ncbi:MAG: hypothetical protein IJU39_03225 [Clostridia bacterium]|nr:hypothetical protein [Clostridia bacterium]
MATKKKEPEFLTYKDKPLVRCNNTIYYGDMNDPYVIMLQIVSNKEENGVQMAEKVIVQLLSTDPDASPRERIVKKSEKKGLYNAMDIGAIWLKRALNPKS